MVEVASDGEVAYQQMLQFQPDVAILDVMMPKMSGYEICQKMNGDKNIGIILLTAKNDISDKVVGIELGADDYIIKPFDIRGSIGESEIHIAKVTTTDDINKWNISYIRFSDR